MTAQRSHSLVEPASGVHKRAKPLSTISASVEAAAAAMDSFAPAREGVLKKPRKAPSIPDKAFAKITLQVLRMVREGDWSEAAPRHFVALYALMHERVYKVPASELTPMVRSMASLAASNLMKREFTVIGEDRVDLAKMASFMRWVWIREDLRAKDRAKSGRETTFRISWRFMFGGSLVTDFRMAKVAR